MMDPLKATLERIEKASIERDNDLANHINRLTRTQRISQQISQIQQQKEILSHVYQKSSAYTNLVILGGYAGMFGIWHLTNAQLSKWQSLFAAVLMTISILLFAGFEVYKMIAHAFLFRRLGRVIESGSIEPDNSNAWHLAWDDFNQKESKTWMLFLIPTVLSGFGAGLFLLVVFLINIFE